MNARRNGLIALLIAFVALGILTLSQRPSQQILTPEEAVLRSLTPVASGEQEPALIAIPTGLVTFYRVFPELAVLDIAGIRIRSPENEQSFLLTRDEAGNWQAPNSEGTLNADTATSIARTMALMPYVSIVTAADADLTLYGFQPEGILSLEIAMANGETHVVAVGYRTPTASGYYAFVDDRPELYILDRAPIDYLISQLREPPVA